MRRGSSFVAIFIGYFPFPVATINVQCRENRGLPQKVESFINVQYAIRVSDRYCTELAVVYIDLDCFFFLGCKHEGGHSHCLRQLNHIHCHHLVDIVFFKLPCLRFGSVWCRKDWLLPYGIYFHFVLGSLTRSKSPFHTSRNSKSIFKNFGPMRTVVA